MDEFLRYSGAVRRDPKIETWFSGMTDPHRLMVRRWFERMRTAAPTFASCCTTAVLSRASGTPLFAYVNAFKAHANVGFFHGAMLADPAGLLEGAGAHAACEAALPAGSWTRRP